MTDSAYDHENPPPISRRPLPPWTDKPPRPHCAEIRAEMLNGSRNYRLGLSVSIHESGYAFIATGFLGCGIGGVGNFDCDDVDELIERLVELRDRARDHFGERWKVAE